ncbi:MULTISPECIES: pilus assembly PilX family protein [Comamonas]|uniref:pilus assembly PilX family protein n=1 Tax=Comamonas TaxID=283 RepID=UPI0005101529|nr:MULTISPECIES: PilX N-terminal domain-containing pilus assembly protein [Comamonas]KGG98467.1 Tfp pilus assembly protein PilX-like protein [Comamonas thiooxydans]KGH09065.1 Tfp pilus assembly protein PilX-like protein [Comamonas thiooxydans]TZG12618.1 pilus assembly protein PilX [Comamonas thiooxydans]UNV89968.1 PilX N-terminal domain-containing pilus assembly protein [Comamonas sp. 7D-2evo1]UNV96731.1 PilX N-terminal domain-containing pilus assembly protein [Comamonas sp. 7D-2]
MERYKKSSTHNKNQQGIALFVVIILVMLSMLLALWASRTSLFGEMLVGNDADYQRAFEAAQALLQDAELDIRGEKADGTLCGAPPCRAYSSALQFPADTREINPLITTLAGISTRCKDALCARRVGRQDFWNYIDDKTSISPSADASLGEVPLSEMTKVGARYGQFTGAAHTTDNGQLNPILTETADDKGGWYWIEVMRYSDAAKTANLIVDATTSQLPLNLDVYVTYRITALAKGRKQGTTVVLQETYARQRMKD